MSGRKLLVIILIAAASLPATTLLAQTETSSSSPDGRRPARPASPGVSGAPSGLASDNFNAAPHKLVDKLARPSEEFSKVDMRVLYQRKLDMFNGQRYCRAPQPDKSVLARTPVSATAAAHMTPASGGRAISTLILLVPILGLGVLFVVIRMGLLDRETDEKKPRRKDPRLKVTLTNQ